jgi:hypothetical protein
VVRQFGAVIEKLNHKFDTRFESFAHTEENVRNCFRQIEERNKRKYGEGQRVIERIVARPSSERKEFKEKMMRKFLKEDMTRLRKDALKTYRRFTTFD